MDNADQDKREEIQALSAIFADDWFAEDPNNDCYSIKLNCASGKQVRLQLKLPPGYPTTDRPTLNVSAPWMSRVDKSNLVDDLNSVCDQNSGQTVIYQLISQAQVNLDSIAERDCKSDHESATHSPPHTPEPNEEPCDITIYHGSPLVDRKSTFQAHLAAVHSPEEAQQVLTKLKENRKINAATHNMWAYRIRRSTGSDSSAFNHNCDDDGETHAGSRMLHLLQIVNAANVMVVVSRWYGGIQLGPDRFKHINNVMRTLLAQHNYINK